MWQIEFGYIDFHLVSAADIGGCAPYDIPEGCEDEVAKRQGRTEHARAEEADMINFGSFLWSEHWKNDYRPASDTPEGGHGDEDTTTETTTTQTSTIVAEPVEIVDETTGETH